MAFNGHNQGGFVDTGQNAAPAAGVIGARQGNWLAWLVLTLSLLVSLGAWRWSEDHARQAQQVEFLTRAAEIREALHARMAGYQQILKGAAALFAASGEVTREEWRDYYRGLELESTYPAIQALAFARAFAHEELAAVKREMRAHGLPGFDLRPPGPRPRYVANVYTEPFEGLNVKAIGYDMWQDPVRRRTMEQALATRQPAITPRVTLKVDETDHPVPAFIMYLPAFDRGGRLRGFVLSPFRMPALAGDLPTRPAHGVSFAIFDGTEPGERALLHRSSQAADEHRPKFTQNEVVTFAGRQWTLAFASEPALESSEESNTARFALAAGILLSLSLFWLVRGITGGRQRAQALARAMTAELHEKQRFLSDLIENSGALIFVKDRDSAHRLVNRKWEEVTGLSREEALGKTNAMLLPEVSARSFRESDLEVMQTGAALEREEMLETPDGPRHFIVMKFPLRGNDGEVTGVCGVATEITDRKRSEAELRLAASVFEQAHEAIVITDERATILAVSRRFTAITGYRADEVIGQNPRILQSGRQDAAFYRAMWGALTTAGHWDGEIWNRRKNGDIYPEWLSISAVRDEAGRTTNYVAVFSDLTERKAAEEAMRQMNRDLERRVAERTEELQGAVRELEAFSYSVSHDLRAPLRAINGFSQLLEEEYGASLDETAHGYLARVRAGSVRMGELIDDLHELSRVSRQPMRFVAVDLSQLAAEIAAELAEAEPGRAVEWSIADGVAATCDAGLIRAVLANLLGNAWKYTGKREVARIAFGVEAGSGEPVYYVRDNGVGFDMKFADKLFGAFQRLHSPADFPGTGIGLATVARIVHRHGGRVWGEGRPGEGAVFRFSLHGDADNAGASGRP
jgi:PAS domain S-box-containing protein